MLAVLLAGCGARAPAAASKTRVAASGHGPTTTSTTAPSPTTTSGPSTAAPPTTAPPGTTPTTATPATSDPTTAPSTTLPPTLADRLVGVGSAGQVVAVTASGYGQTTATVTAYQRVAGGWQQVFGPWTGFLGYNGFAPPGEKREGDGRTPSGSYGFGFFFGIQPNPGVHFPWRAVTASDVWDDDPASPSYNQWVDTSTGTDPGADPEPMDNAPAYDAGAVIAYNSDPVVPGAGSAIFFHVATGGPTAGCVSLPADQLLSVLRWLNPADGPRIVMGTLSTVTGG